MLARDHCRQVEFVLTSNELARASCAASVQIVVFTMRDSRRFAMVRPGVLGAVDWPEAAGQGWFVYQNVRVGQTLDGFGFYVDKRSGTLARALFDRVGEQKDGDGDEHASQRG